MKKHLIFNEETLSIAIASIKNYAKKNKVFNIKIENIAEKRNDKQLKYYWVLIDIITDYLNEQGNDYTKEQTSNLMKGKFFYQDEVVFNEKRRVLKSIANNSETDKQEMREFIKKVVNFCNEWGIIIPICDDEYNIS